MNKEEYIRTKNESCLSHSLKKKFKKSNKGVINNCKMRLEMAQVHVRSTTNCDYTVLICEHYEMWRAFLQFTTGITKVKLLFQI